MSARLKLWGSFITAAWLVLCGVYLVGVYGWGCFITLPPNEMGDFAAGVAAPIAFLWLVLGFLLQSEELRLQREQLSLQRTELELQRKETQRLADEAHRQAVAITANEMHARRDTFLRVADLTTKELEAIARDLVDKLGPPARGSAKEIWESGDHRAYFTVLVLSLTDKGNRLSNIERMRKNPHWEQPFLAFKDKFEVVLKGANECDPSGYFESHFRESEMGKLYKICKIVCAEFVTDFLDKADGR